MAHLKKTTKRDRGFSWRIGSAVVVRFDGLGSKPSPIDQTFTLSGACTSNSMYLQIMDW